MTKLPIEEVLRDAREQEMSACVSVWVRNWSPKLVRALKKIAELDPETDSQDGFNEWGEADCFRQAQKIAKDVLGIS